MNDLQMNIYCTSYAILFHFASSNIADIEKDIKNLKGQSHEKVCEIMTSDARIGLN
jgi:hypothetical protein